MNTAIGAPSDLSALPTQPVLLQNQFTQPPEEKTSDDKLPINAFTLKHALAWSAFWVSMALIFCSGIWFTMGASQALTWMSVYLTEKLLSFDNLFVFFSIFKYLKTSPQDQRSALNWGLIGAVILRGLLIFAATAGLSFAPWLLYLCDGFLLYTGIQMFREDANNEDESELDSNISRVDRIRSWMGSCSVFLMTIVAIELSDILFALDSIPASLGITTDLFTVASANLFAILGLRSLYFVMQASIEKFHFLEKGVATILTGIGLKMLLESVFTVSTPVTFAFVVSTMAISILLSCMKEHANKPGMSDNPGYVKNVCTFFFKPRVPQESEKEIEIKQDLSQAPS